MPKKISQEIIQACKTKEVKQAIENGADINSKDSQGRTVLYRAAEEGKHQLFSWLVEKGANHNISANNGTSPYNIACNNLDKPKTKKCWFAKAPKSPRDHQEIVDSLVRMGIHMPSPRAVVINLEKIEVDDASDTSDCSEPSAVSPTFNCTIL